MVKLWHIAIWLILAVFAFGMYFATPTWDSAIINMTTSPQQTIDLFQTGFFGLFMLGVGMFFFLMFKLGTGVL